jgi:hypothetical protein
MRVELGKVREFARAVKSSDAAYLAGPEPLTPPTFLTVARNWQDGHQTVWGARNLGRILHGEQEFVFHGEPPRAGDVLTGQMRIDRTYEKAGRRGGTMQFVEVVTEFRDAAGRFVAESRGTVIETERAASEG